MRSLPPALLSGLAFAGANRVPGPGEDDGLWTALEVSALDLSRVELAVLSACETGLGKVAGGEGVLGLQRALQVSGVRTSISTLWSIPDVATAELMRRFYDNLWKRGLSPLLALREAQLALLREGGSESGAVRGPLRTALGPRAEIPARLPPFFWGAFVLSGDWR
jgi:CHAT domain-containing protein